MNLLSLTEAKKIALHYLNVTLEPKLEIALYEDKIIEFEEGYLFSYDAKKFIEEQDFSYRITGIHPIIVDKSNGQIFHTIEPLPDRELINKFKLEKNTGLSNDT